MDDDTGSAAFTFTALTGVVNFLSTFPGIFLVDRFGRTKLLRWSAIGMSCSCLALGIVGSTCIESVSCGLVGVSSIFFFVFNFA